jgi:hypothetical protein
VTNAELAHQLNSELGLSGRGAVTSNVIRQWVAWGVLPKAQAKGQSMGRGPTWSRSDFAMRRAMRLAELRKWGVTRESALIAQVFFEWGHSDLERVRRSLLMEVNKWRSQLARPRTTFLDNSNYEAASAVQKRAIRNQLGRLDSRFVGTQFEQSGELYATVADWAMRGEGDVRKLSVLLLSAMETMLPGFGATVSQREPNTLLVTMKGVLGSPEEIDHSSISAIEIASGRELRSARVIMKRMLKVIGMAEILLRIPSIDPGLRNLIVMLEKLNPQITVGPWSIMHFTQCLLAVHRIEVPANPSNWPVSRTQKRKVPV